MNEYRNWVLSGIPIVLLLCLHPSQLGKLGIIDGKVAAFFLFAVFITTYFVKNEKVTAAIDTYDAVLFVQIVFFLLLSIFFDAANVLTAGTLLALAVVYWVSKSDAVLLVHSARAYVWLMSAISIASIAAVIGFYSGYFQQVFLVTTESARDLYLIGTSLTTETFIQDGIVRPAGPFAEPGQLGVHLTFALILNYLLGCNRKYEAVLILGMLATLSMGAYLTLMLYLILLRLRAVRGAHWFYFLVCILIGLSLLSLDEKLQNYLGARIPTLFTLGNRELGYEAFFNNMHAINLFTTDAGVLDQLSESSVEATAFGMIMRYGYLGAIIVNLHLFVFFTKQSRAVLLGGRGKRTIAFVIAVTVLSMLLHRPFVIMFSFYYLILLTSKLSIPKREPGEIMLRELASFHRA